MEKLDDTDEIVDTIKVPSARSTLNGHKQSKTTSVTLQFHDTDVVENRRIAKSRVDEILDTSSCVEPCFAREKTHQKLIRPPREIAIVLNRGDTFSFQNILKYSPCCRLLVSGF